MILNVAPMFDMPTEYSAKWNQRLMEELGEKHTDLLAEDAVRRSFEENVKEIDPDLVVFYDHGSETRLIGNDEKPLLDSRNVSLLKGREMYTMCCLAAKNLGADAYRKGCKAWWGHTAVFAFTTTDEYLFGALANMGLILRRKEHPSWEDCVVRVKDAYNEKIEELRDSGNPWTIMALIGNRESLVCWTDDNQPPSDCAFRNFAVRIMGTAGQKISTPCVLATIAYYSSWGYGLHDFGHQVWELKGTVLSLEGGYVAFALMFIFPLVVLREHVKWLGR